MKLDQKLQTLATLAGCGALNGEHRDNIKRESSQCHDFRSIFISDVHLGTKDCKAKELNQFLKTHSCERLYLVGDIFDGWKMRKGVHWNKDFSRLIRRFLKIAKSGTPIYYITGNHDEFLRRYATTQFDNIYLLNRTSHYTPDGRKYLILHGDQFEGLTHCPALLKFIGDKGYDFLMKINRAYNRVRVAFGGDYWSFSGFLKAHVSRAKAYILAYEETAASGAKKQGFDGVICGHIHQAANKHIDGVNYINTGDWVESCTAITEDAQGNMQLIHWLEHDTYRSLQQKTKSRAKIFNNKSKNHKRAIAV